MTFTAAQKIEALERELKIRQRVYANRVLTHRMSKRGAKYQIDIVIEMIEDYKQLQQKEKLV